MSELNHKIIKTIKFITFVILEILIPNDRYLRKYWETKHFVSNKNVRKKLDETETTSKSTYSIWEKNFLQNSPVEAGMMFWAAPLPSRHFFPLPCPSTTFWVAVYECTVVISPSTTPKRSSIIFTRGARAFVVHEAHDTTLSDFV